MASVTFTYANGQTETVPLVGSVRVEVDSDTPISRTLSTSGLTGISLSETKKADTEAHGVGAATVADIEAAAGGDKTLSEKAADARRKRRRAKAAADRAAEKKAAADAKKNPPKKDG